MKPSCILSLVLLTLVVVLILSPPRASAQSHRQEGSSPSTFEMGEPFLLSPDESPFPDFVGAQCATNADEELTVCLVQCFRQIMDCGNLYHVVFEVRRPDRVDSINVTLGTPGCPALPFIPKEGLEWTRAGVSFTLLPPHPSSRVTEQEMVSSFRVCVERVARPGLQP